MKNLLLVLVLLLSAYSWAQETGTVEGTLTDKETNDEPLPFANVSIKGTTKGGTTDFDGKYVIENVPVGTYTAEFSFVGYETVEVPNVKIETNKFTNVSTSLGASAAALDEVLITVQTSREREEALLLEQKMAITITQTIGAEELARKGVSNAEGAVAKLSGITKQDGVKNVFVRGLGDRYNTTSLNGLPLPSEDPEYKNISLDFFASGIIQSVDVNKTFLPSTFGGDVGGANINIRSKELSGMDELVVKVGSGLNTRAFNSDFLTIDGTNRFGTELKKESPITSFQQYNFKNSFDPNNSSSQINYDGSLRLGKRWNIGDNRLTALFVGSVDNDYSYKEGNIATYNSAGNQGQNQDFKRSDYGIAQLASLNLDYKFGIHNNRITLNNMFIRQVGQSVGEYLGENPSISDQSELKDFTRRQQTNKNNLFVNQLITKFYLNDKIDLNVSGSYNFTRGSEPDRRTNSFIRRLNDNEDFYRVAVGSAGLNNRFYSDLEEDEIAGAASVDYKLGNTDESSNNKITLGYNFRNTKRTFNFVQYSFQFKQQYRVDLNNVDALFNQDRLDAGDFEIYTNRGRFSPDPEIEQARLRPGYYTGDKTIHAGFADAVYDLTDNLTLSGGLRFENIDQIVEFDTQLASSVNNPNIDPGTINRHYFLPSLNVKYDFTENQILRLAASETYILPQFKEVAPFLYEDVSFSSQGNPNLLPSDVYNFDLKYEFYPSSSEVLSVTGFYKLIKDPINRIRVNSAANDLSYVNVGNANVAGVELELRKNLYESGSESTNTKQLQLGLNASYLYSTQKLIDVDTDQLTVRFTNDKDALEGASPVLVNSDLTFNYDKNDFGLTSSLVGNFFSNRIYSLGTAGNENLVEQSRISLDFVNTINFNKHFSLDLKARNLLDPNYEITQEVMGNDLNVSSYKRGLTISAGLSYTF